MTNMKTWNISRRNLLKGAGAGAAVLGLAGCSSGSASGSDAGSSATAAASVTENEAETVTCTSDYVGADADTINEWAETTIYDVDAQAAIAEDLETQKDGQTLAQPLVVYNPFGTNSQGLYVYFTTEEETTVEYTVSISDETFAAIDDATLTADSIADFTRSVNGGESATEFEFMLYGLIPNVENTVTITATYESGDVETTTFACEMCDILGPEELQLVVTEGESDAELEDGLYAILGNQNSDVCYTYLYDNDGILRSELPIDSFRSERFIFEDDLMYFSYSYNDLAAMNSIGQIVKTYPLDVENNYRLHHDYVSDGDNHLLVLGTDNDSGTIEDLIYSVNQETCEIDYVLDMGDLMTDYMEEAIENHYEALGDAEDDDLLGETGVDWIHINTIQWMGDDSVLLSCRELSAIIKVSDFYGEPYIDYIISSKEYWEGTEYEDLVLDQDGDFTVQGGQHSITYVEDDSLDEGQYYVYLFNNNSGVSLDDTTDFDFASIGLTNTGTTSDEEGVYSYYYKYLVDENARTFSLVDSFEIPYSGFYSSVQDLDSNIVVDSGALGWYGEYDEDGTLIRSFEMDIEMFIYRVYKYDL